MGPTTRVFDGAGERASASATASGDAAPSGAPVGEHKPEQPGSSASRPASAARARSRSPEEPRIDHFARAQVRVLPGLFDLYGRVDPTAWRVDHIEFDRDSVFYLRFCSRVAEGDAAAGPARYRVLVATVTLVGARVAVRLRPETASDRLRSSRHPLSTGSGRPSKVPWPTGSQTSKARQNIRALRTRREPPPDLRGVSDLHSQQTGG